MIGAVPTLRLPGTPRQLQSGNSQTPQRLLGAPLRGHNTAQNIFGLKNATPIPANLMLTLPSYVSNVCSLAVRALILH